MTVTIAAASAVTTAHTPPTADSEVAPNRSSARNETSRLGRTTRVISTLTLTTTKQRQCRQADRRRLAARVAVMDLGRVELVRGGGALAHPLVFGRFVDGYRGAPPKPSPLRRAAVSACRSHHSPKASMIAEAMIPRPGAASGVVPKNGIGIAFWIAGVPGSADIVKVDVPKATVAGISRLGIAAVRNKACAIGTSTKNATNRLTPP